MKGKK